MVGPEVEGQGGSGRAGREWTGREGVDGEGAGHEYVLNNNHTADSYSFYNGGNASVG